MRRAIATIVLCAGIAVSAGTLPAVAAAPPSPVSVELSRTAVSVGAGERFSFSSTMRNESDQPMTGLIAHLNIASLDPDVYVDPEDWSPKRTQYVDTLPAGASTTLRWNVQAVGSGRFIVYVVVAEPAESAGVSGSPPLHLAVSQRRALNSGNVLPVAAAVPAAVLVLMGVAARRRRRLR